MCFCCPSIQMEGVTLPVVRNLATIQLRLSEVLVNMFTEHVDHQQRKSLRVREQPSVERVSLGECVSLGQGGVCEFGGVCVFGGVCEFRGSV